MNLPPTEPGGSRPSSAFEGRFALPGGSRPLEGFTIKRGIGRGGFGEVYYATSDAGKEVALKLIRRNLDVELRGIKQCLNLKHPNLLAIYDIREDERGDNWVVMEYVAGESLDEVIAAYPNGLAADEAIRWFHGIATGVAYLHDHGIVHRDLKPGNIFSDEGRVEIGDYGLSKFISCSRRSGQTESVGTVHYMAPEVANGRYGKEIDIYAMGVVLYEMLTGRVPFDGESVGEVLMKHLTAEPDVSVLAEPYRSVVARALAKDPAERFKSVGEMLARLPHPPGTIPPAVEQTGPAAARAKPATPFAAAVPVAEVAEEEPILRGVQRLLRRTRDAWNESHLNTPTKIVILAVAIILFLSTSDVVIPLAVMMLITYGIYRAIRAIVLAGRPSRHHRSTPPPPPPTISQAAAAPKPPHTAARVHHVARERHIRRARSREEAAAALVLGQPRERVCELVGSMLGGALVALTMCLVMVILAGFNYSEILRPEQSAWLVLVSIAGTWCVMVPSKFWEGTRGDPMLRRFVLMAIGLCLGAFAFGTAETLMVNLTYDHNFPPPHDVRMPSSFYSNGPLLLAHMAVFGTLFLALRWWQQADPLRSTRMSLWSMVVTSAMAGLVAWLWHFPQPWLIMVACTISVSVQLASPWLHPRRRVVSQNS